MWRSMADSMKLFRMRHKILIFGVLAAGLLLSSCVKVDNTLGQNFRPYEQQHRVFNASKPITDITVAPIQNLSAYNQYRITVGVINDGVASASRSSAITLVPCYKTLNFGTDPKLKSISMNMAKDTTCVIDESQKDMIQNLHIFSLKDVGVVLDSSYVYADELSDDLFAGKREITKGTPVYSGEKKFNTYFSDEFASELMNDFLSLSEKTDTGYVYTLDMIPQYIKDFPGIYITSEEPLFRGGRINMFKTSPQYTDDGYIDSNYCRLDFTSDYGDRKGVDTCFVFIFGAREVVSENTSGNVQCYAFNVSSEKTVGELTDNTSLRVQGGMGDKPVISGAGLRKLMMQMLEEAGIGKEHYDEVVVNKATINMPFEYPADYDEIEMFPRYLSATCKLPAYIGTRKYYTYINLADANISTENHGEINYSTSSYNPDFTFHAQKLLALSDEDAAVDTLIAKYDLWFMIQADEVVYNRANTYSNSDYYNQLYYASYLNQMYNGGYGYGYGGLGGYGSYGSDYYNYYNMMYYYNSMMQQQSSSTTASTEVLLDRDRFYRGSLIGPGTTGDRRPTLSMTFSVPAPYVAE